MSCGGLDFRRRVWLRIGAEIGADVPFFLRAWRGGGAAYASGIGEILRAAPAPARREFLLLCPHRPTSTAAVFALFAGGRAGEKSAIISPARRRAVIDLAARNDLAAAAVACNPHIAAAGGAAASGGLCAEIIGRGRRGVCGVCGADGARRGGGAIASGGERRIRGFLRALCDGRECEKKWRR